MDIRLAEPLKTAHPHRARTLTGLKAGVNESAGSEFELRWA
jgi:hypothetical protein